MSKDTNASKVSNGSCLWVEPTDGRRAPARRYRDLYNDLLIEIGGPGPKITEPQRQLCRRAAGLMILAERSECAMANGEVVDPGAYVKICGSLSRVLVALGIEPAPPGQEEATPTLASYFAPHGGDAPGND